ncbi:hypothetical protein FB446DRAFT_747228 [Lentinula raphanica]|nr:hypothetical protein FB446DRAFT_747228 [Lentinula raphanica]
MATRTVFQQHGPVRLIAFGGFNIVWYFRTRQSTYDLDFYHPGPISANGNTFQEVPADVVRELENLIARVARRQSILPLSWANDAATLFVDRTLQANNIIHRSFQQNIILYQSDQLVIYMGDLVFQLAQKLWLMNHRNRRSTDRSDAASFASYFLRFRGHNMTVQELQTQWPQLMSTVSQTEIDEVNDVAQTVYHRNVLE